MSDTPSASTYVLGHQPTELQRLIDQARFYEPLTRPLLQQAGISPGMHVLDVGSGVGDVAFLLAELVGPSGSVVGVDRSPEAIATASARANERGLQHVRFMQADLGQLQLEQRFDALVGRLVLMYQPDPAAALRHLTSLLQPSAVICFQELNIASTSTAHPPLPLVEQCWSWAVAACQQAGIALNMGLRLHHTFVQAGLPAPEMQLQGRATSPDEQLAFTFLAETVRTLLPLIERFGIASAAEVEVDTLAARLQAEAQAQQSTLVASMLVGAWTRRSA